MPPPVIFDKSSDSVTKEGDAVQSESGKSVKKVYWHPVVHAYPNAALLLFRYVVFANPPNDAVTDGMKVEVT